MQIKPNQNTSIDIDSTVAVEDDISNRLDRRISDVEMQFFGFEIKQIKQEERNFRHFLSYCRDRAKYYVAGLIGVDN